MKLQPARFAFDGAPEISNAVTISSSNGASMAELFAPAGQNVGPAVTDGSALQVGTVYACLEKLGGVVLQLPLHHYGLNADGDRERIMPPQPIWWLLNESPSPAWTAASWKEWIVRCVKLRGDQHTQILRNARGEAIGLMPLHPDYVQVSTVNKRLRYAVWDADAVRAYGVDQDDILHFTGFGFDGERSVSAIKWAARNAISNSLSSAAFMGKSLADHGMPRISIEYPGKLDSDQAQIVRSSFVSTYLSPESKSRFPFVSTQGGKIVPLDISPVDLELMAARRMDKAEICEALGVPPIIIGDSEKTSSWGTGVEQVTLGWVRFSVQPMLARWEEEMNRKLFRRAGQFVEFSLEALLRGDSKAQSEAFRAAIGGPGTGNGYMTVNEIRKLKNLPADTEPESSKLFRSVVNAPPNPAATAAASAQASMVQAIIAMASREPAPSVVNVAAPVVNVTPSPIEVRAGDTTVTLPEGCIRVENVVNTPAVRAGDVHVDVQPVELTVHASAATRQTIKRDAAGDIAEIVTRPAQE